MSVWDLIREMMGREPALRSSPFQNRAPKANRSRRRNSHIPGRKARNKMPAPIHEAIEETGWQELRKRRYDMTCATFRARERKIKRNRERRERKALRDE